MINLKTCRTHCQHYSNFQRLCILNKKFEHYNNKIAIFLLLELRLQLLNFVRD